MVCHIGVEMDGYLSVRFFLILLNIFLYAFKFGLGAAPCSVNPGQKRTITDKNVCGGAHGRFHFSVSTHMLAVILIPDQCAAKIDRQNPPDFQKKKKKYSEKEKTYGKRKNRRNFYIC